MTVRKTDQQPGLHQLDMREGETNRVRNLIGESSYSTKREEGLKKYEEIKQVGKWPMKMSNHRDLRVILMKLIVD